jgi:hypothetical protein
MDPLYGQQYIKLCRAVEIMRKEFGCAIDNAGWLLPWDGTFLGFTASLGEKGLTPERVEWLWRGLRSNRRKPSAAGLKSIRLFRFHA